MNETKYYKSGRIYYKVTVNRLERVYAYSHCFGIENTDQKLDSEDFDFSEITETQYNRVKRLVLAKLLNQ